jgi:phi LC3 family holin
MVKLIKSVNWRVRVRNRSWWLKMIPATLLVIQVVANVFGYQPDFGDLGNKLAAVVNAVFGLIAIIGIIEDPTTEGIADSHQAQTYEKPKHKGL